MTDINILIKEDDNGNLSMQGDCSVGVMIYQFDSNAHQFVFERPADFTNHSLVLYFSNGIKNFEPVNIHKGNNFTISNALTQTNTLRLQIAFKEKCEFRKGVNTLQYNIFGSIASGKLPPDSFPDDLSELMQNAFVDVEQTGESVVFRNSSGTEVGGINAIKGDQGPPGDSLRIVQHIPGPGKPPVTTIPLELDTRFVTDLFSSSIPFSFPPPKTDNVSVCEALLKLAPSVTAPNPSPAELMEKSDAPAWYSLGGGAVLLYRFVYNGSKWTYTWMEVDSGFYGAGMNMRNRILTGATTLQTNMINFSDSDPGTPPSTIAEGDFPKTIDPITIIFNKINNLFRWLVKKQPKGDNNSTRNVINSPTENYLSAIGVMNPSNPLEVLSYAQLKVLQTTVGNLNDVLEARLHGG